MKIKSFESELLSSKLILGFKVVNFLLSNLGILAAVTFQFDEVENVVLFRTHSRINYSDLSFVMFTYHMYCIVLEIEHDTACMQSNVYIPQSWREHRCVYS